MGNTDLSILKNNRRSFKNCLILSLLMISFIIMIIYVIVRILLFINQGLPWYEKIPAFALLFVECFVLIHTFGYFLNLFHVIKHSQKVKSSNISTLTSYPPVAIVVASYKEPLAVLKNTLTCFYNLSYPNKHLFFLDDTRYDLAWDTPENVQKYRTSIEELCQWMDINLFRAKWHGAKAGMLNDFLQFLAGNMREDFEFHPYSTKKTTEPIKYLIVFDADMNPLPDFVESLVAMIENRPKTAFIQTPQYYTNFETNRIARAAGLQQAIFYEYICEGKSLKNAMFCCGTNVLFRIEALMDVGGFDEISVTEDFETSLKLHLKGWDSAYLNKIGAFGMGPEDLGGYFKQQFRWARGTTGMLKKLPKEMIKNFNQFSVAKWWEYFLSSTHYFVGWAFLIMVVSPILYLFFNIPSYFVNPEIYFSIFAPYIVLTMVIFIYTLKNRNYRPLALITPLLINAVAFPVFIKATFSALLGIKATFGITPKTGSTILPLRALSVQMTTALLCFAAITWGLMRLYYEREPFYGILINIIWCTYNFCILSSVLYFNHSQETQEPC